MTSPQPGAEDVVAAASPVFARVGSAWYFVPETVAAGRAAGLDGLRFYFLGRGGTLGRVDWRVVASAFGYFNPTLVEKMWTTGAERCDVVTAARAHLAAGHDFGRRRLDGVAGLPEFCEAAEAVVTAAAADLGALTLFAGYAAQPLPGDVPARALQLVATLRELRGSVHLAAVVAAGLATPVAHAIRRPGDVEMFGWRQGDIPAPTEGDRDRLRHADRATDEVLARVYRACGDDVLRAVAAGAGAIAAAVPAA